MTIAAALASRPEVGSSMNMMDGFETSSTAIVSRLRCSFDIPLTPALSRISIEHNSFSPVTLLKLSLPLE
ncbi:hypothetical protein LWI29_005829 [Acer saccharum]|uniref:Uncharacterized protein n=1 Tax=Acer saccharum TaxID=4024 RepID=A0AA39VIC5_ACESA|nr:hypothetical protein LWI29_005829 [Acer saccharum]